MIFIFNLICIMPKLIDEQPIYQGKCTTKATWPPDHRCKSLFPKSILGPSTGIPKIINICSMFGYTVWKALMSWPDVKLPPQTQLDWYSDREKSQLAIIIDIQWVLKWELSDKNKFSSNTCSSNYFLRWHCVCSIYTLKCVIINIMISHLMLQKRLSVKAH